MAQGRRACNGLRVIGGLPLRGAVVPIGWAVTRDPLCGSLALMLSEAMQLSDPDGLPQSNQTEVTVFTLS